MSLEKQPDSSSNPVPRSSGPARDEISLLDIGVALARKRSLIVRTTLLFTLVGLVFAVLQTPRYQSSMRFMSELGGERSGGGIGATLRNFGFSLPGTSSPGTLSTKAIPDIVRSRAVRIAVAQDTFYVPAIQRDATLVEYLESRGSFFGSVVGFIRSYTIGLPGKIVALFRPAPSGPGGESTPDLVAQDNAARWLANAVNANEDFESGLITISVTADDPALSYQLVNSVADKLRKRVQELYTNKARQDLAFIEGQFEVARSELQDADEALAVFEDRNQNRQSSRMNLDRDRLQREVTFKSQLYSELQAQRTQARIELQRSEPVITTIEEAVPLPQGAGPNRKMTVLIAFFLGIMISIGLALVSSALEATRDSKADNAKLAEITEALPRVPGFLANRFGCGRRPS